MSLTLGSIQGAKDDEQLLQLLSDELLRLFPGEVQENLDEFLAALTKAPRGLRAMSGIYELDVSMSLDDVAWHFGNHNDERFLEETLASLRELEADEAADLFLAAWEIVKPHLHDIRTKDWKKEDFPDFLERTGIQSKIEPLNERMWAVCKQSGDRGLLQYWLTYARKYPERCLPPS